MAYGVLSVSVCLCHRGRLLVLEYSMNCMNCTCPHDMTPYGTYRISLLHLSPFSIPRTVEEVVVCSSAWSLPSGLELSVDAPEPSTGALPRLGVPCVGGADAYRGSNTRIVFPRRWGMAHARSNNRSDHVSVSPSAAGRLDQPLCSCHVGEDGSKWQVATSLAFRVISCVESHVFDRDTSSVMYVGTCMRMCMCPAANCAAQCEQWWWAVDDWNIRVARFVGDEHSGRIAGVRGARDWHSTELLLLPMWRGKDVSLRPTKVDHRATFNQLLPTIKRQARALRHTTAPCTELPRCLSHTAPRQTCSEKHHAASCRQVVYVYRPQVRGDGSSFKSQVSSLKRWASGEDEYELGGCKAFMVDDAMWLPASA
jgi:hypothetical protein